MDEFGSQSDLSPFFSGDGMDRGGINSFSEVCIFFHSRPEVLNVAVKSM